MNHFEELDLLVSAEVKPRDLGEIYPARFQAVLVGPCAACTNEPGA